MKKTFLAIVLLSSAFAIAAPKHTEAQVYSYRLTMKAANQDLQNGNSQRAFLRIKFMAEQDFPEAQYLLGTLYEDGEGTKKDLTKAREWYTKAATQTANAETATLAKQALAEMQ
ncbi:SEL1-like repeat protein [Wielerella bovis]|uniref:SEL1-like repeat protein n=1 Tax=Wielerella bovis TaxID=2917790 RepID=UPI002018C33C|nr:SEL1-like repeat protein [Wielerella bovis]MCG7657093.1 SEL1-like repeat protein [Wielerella bovis]MCG7659316.1 SEL1-like repeat protein [Wielerella bovis]